MTVPCPVKSRSCQELSLAPFLSWREGRCEPYVLPWGALGILGSRQEWLGRNCCLRRLRNRMAQALYCRLHEPDCFVRVLLSTTSLQCCTMLKPVTMTTRRPLTETCVVRPSSFAGPCFTAMLMPTIAMTKPIVIDPSWD